MKTLQLLLIFCFATLIFACDDDDFNDTITGNEPTDVTGITYVEDEDQSFDEVYNSIRSDVAANSNITIVAEVDHMANAASVSMNLRPTSVMLFGNPMLGTPLMQQNMLAGLDLPQRLVIYQESDDDIIVAYNSTRYLASRYNLQDNGELTNIGNALMQLVEDNTDESVTNSFDVEVDENEGVVTVTTTGTVDSVYTRLRNIISSNANLSIIAELDHSANAASAGMTLPASKLIVFGNPNLGTPLMMDDQSIALDLPQKMLVFANGNGGVTIAYNDPFFLADRHDVDDDLEELQMISDALSNLANTAANN